MIIINVENSCAASDFCGNSDTFCFLGFCDEQSSKEQQLFEEEMFCKIINVFPVAFDQFNASLKNKNILTSVKKTTFFYVTLCLSVWEHDNSVNMNLHTRCK